MMRKLILIVFIFILIGAKMQSYGQNTRETAYLETIANIVGHDLYISYTYLGSLTDSYIYRVYAQKFALNLLNEYVDYINVIIHQLEKMLEQNLVPQPDIHYLQMQIEAYQTMRLQAQEFIRYVETGESKYVESFENHRRKSWTLVATILGIPEEIEKVYKD